MLRIGHFALFILALVTCSQVSAGHKELKHAQNFQISDGLSHSGVTSIIEDSRGYLWVATFDGLNRYDGYEFKVFKNNLDRDILPSNRVRSVAEDFSGNLWIGTEKGIAVYLYDREKFNELAHGENQFSGGSPIAIKFLFNERNKRIFAVTEKNGILIFNSQFELEKAFSYYPDSSIGQNVTFSDGVLLDESTILISTSSGLVLFDAETGIYQQILGEEINQRKFNTALRLGGNRLLVTLVDGIGILKYSKVNGAYLFSVESTHLADYQFNCATVDRLGNLWLGTTNDGIVRVENINSLVYRGTYNISSYITETGLLRISCFFVSPKNGCWVGSYNNGVYRFDLEDNPFKNYSLVSGSEFNIRMNTVRKIRAYFGDKAYLIAYRNGIGLFNTATHQFEALPYYLSEEEQLNVSNVYVDSQKNTWLKLIGDSGLLKVGYKSKKVERVSHPGLESLANANIREITEDGQGNIWIASTTEVFKLVLSNRSHIQKVETLSAHPYFENKDINPIRTIYYDESNDFIWIGTDEDGLIRLKNDPQQALSAVEIEQYTKDPNNKNSISSNFVSSIIRLPNGELWIGTEQGGICKVNNSNEQPHFISFSERDGLSNNVVKSISYDQDNNLWVATNQGLNKIYTKDLTCRRFSVEDGLQFEDFNYASVSLGNGNLILAGVTGFCYFNPGHLLDDEPLPSLEFGGFKIFNKDIAPGDTVSKRIVLEKRMEDQKKIVLKHNENSFTIEVKSLHFSIPESHYLSYQLLPVNDEWIEVPSSRRFLNYNGLQPGEYILRVKASNSLRKWTEPKELQIIVKPPFWRTVPAYVIYLVLVFGIIFIVIFTILRIQSLNHNLQIEKIEKDNVKEVNDAKLRFFSNISHEIKTPISLISGPINQMLEFYRGNLDLHEKLQFIQRQSRKIMQLIEQVHDFQKSEANALKMHNSHFNFDEFVKELLHDYEFKAKTDGKKLEIVRPEDDIYVFADRDKLEKVVNNLLSNAFKYTRKDDTIKVEYKRNGENLHLCVNDSGKGIDTVDLPHIFERFYQSHKENNIYSGGSGIGLAFTKRLVEMHFGFINAESQIGKGTRILVRLPIIKDKPSELEKEQEQALLNSERVLTKSILHPDSIKREKVMFSDEFKGSTIFFAEDNQDMRIFVTGLLADVFNVKAFSNGQECLDAMEDEWPDMVISDLLMPEMNGLELCRQLKTDIRTSHIPVIILTACTSVNDQIKGLTDGADAYIIKPFNNQHLVATIESLLRGRKQLRERFQMNYPLSLSKNGNSNKDSIFFEKLYKIIDDNLDNIDLDVNLLTKSLFISRTNLFSKIKALTNQTPYELIKMYRLQKAAELLAEKELTVNEVYIMTGFKSRSHFSKSFKEKYNVSPGAYYEEVRKQQVG